MAETQALDLGEIMEKVTFETLFERFDLEGWLRQEGEERVGHCPLCLGSSTFTVSPQRNFSCWSCNRRGSIIDFIAAFRGMSLEEAASYLKKHFLVIKLESLDL